MICPKCGFEKTRVYGTRKGLVNERFRECAKCGYKFITKEVIKKDLFSVEYIEWLEEIGEIEKMS